MKRVILIAAGIALLILAAIGFVLPFLPGILFLLLGVICFAFVSPRLKRRLQANPRLRRLFTRLDGSRGMHMMDRLRLTFWAVLEAANPKSTTHRPAARR